MFLGEFEHTIDDKGRLIIPAKYRGELAAGLVVTRGIDQCLFVYPVKEWDELAARISQLPLTQKNARTFTRLIFAGATDLVPDRQGRILLPPYLREYADIEDEAVIIGLNERLEIWNPQRWRDVKSQLEEEADAIAEQLVDLGI